MDVPPFVVVDTSAAVEVLVVDAERRDAYRSLFAELRRAGTGLVFCDLLELELIEAAFTWDLRRGADPRWRGKRKTGSPFAERRPLELSIVDEWRSFVRGGKHAMVRGHDYIDGAIHLMHRTGLSSYDAIHAAAAISLGLPLMAHDRRLLDVASEHVEVITGRVDGVR
jgi:predicted nucleic acid-binding protein